MKRIGQLKKQNWPVQVIFGKENISIIRNFWHLIKNCDCYKNSWSILQTPPKTHQYPICFVLNYRSNYGRVHRSNWSKYTARLVWVIVAIARFVSAWNATHPACGANPSEHKLHEFRSLFRPTRINTRVLLSTSNPVEILLDRISHLNCHVTSRTLPSIIL